MSEDTTIRDLALKIASDYAKSVLERTDELLMLDCIQYTNLGIDSSKSEKKKVKSDSKFIYKQVKSIDTKLGNLLITSLDT
jgi:hypothetical protein|tara:strand:- start:11760 stop:12002 length:243 start_codon:yes stop_codon:yes gene_type:complete